MEIKFAITEYIKNFIKHIGDNPDREGLIETPNRVVNSWAELFNGYTTKVDIKQFEKENYKGLVILKNIDFYSTCEHHVLQFSGICDIGYVPDEKLIGISKLAKIVDLYANRLQIQERLTQQILEHIVDLIQPKGVMVICTAQHNCITSRGVKKINARMVTSSIHGVFENKDLRDEFLQLVYKV